MTQASAAVRFAVIGCGVISRKHAASIGALGDRAELVLGVDEVAERGRVFAEAHAVEFTDSVAQALSRSDVDAVAVCTPSGLHADIAIAALEAGKHVVVEKPLDVSVEAADRVAQAERRAGKTVTVISQHRFDTSSQLVHRAIREGQLGRITSGAVSISLWRSQTYYDSGDWRGTWKLDGGGALMNQGVHTIDLLVWMLGEPVEVFAWTGCLAHDRIEVEDTAAATVRFAGGALGVIHGTTAAYPGLTSRLQVHGSRGSAVIDKDQLAYFHTAESDVDAPAYGAGGAGNQAARLLAGAGEGTAAALEAHATQYRDFLDAIEEDRPPLVTVAEATRTLRVVCGIYESAQAGRPVSLGTGPR